MRASLFIFGRGGLGKRDLHWKGAYYNKKKLILSWNIRLSRLTDRRLRFSVFFFLLAIVFALCNFSARFCSWNADYPLLSLGMTRISFLHPSVHPKSVKTRIWDAEVVIVCYVCICSPLPWPCPPIRDEILTPGYLLITVRASTSTIKGIKRWSWFCNK